TQVRHRDPFRWSGAVTATVATASVGFVVALWLHQSGFQTMLGDSPAAVVSLARLIGLVGADLLLLQVFLMARIPWIERGVGQDRLVRWHRFVGLWSFWLVVAHVALVIIGYTATDGTDVVSESWTLTTDYPGMLLAVAGTALLVGVVALSVRAARRRLRY